MVASPGQEVDDDLRHRVQVPVLEIEPSERFVRRLSHGDLDNCGI